MHLKSLKKIVWTGSAIIPLVTLLTIITATAASVRISWTPNVPPPRGYRVFARRSDQVFDYSLPDWEGRENTCTIDGLEDQTQYYFVVQAFDGDQEGDYSAQIHYLPRVFDCHGRVSDWSTTTFLNSDASPADAGQRNRPT